MLSVAPSPLALVGSLYLPPILPQSATLYASLRQLHTWLAFLLFLTFLLHLGAALLHALIRRDGVFESMASFGSSTPTASRPTQVANPQG
jgi:cytochrome b561